VLVCVTALLEEISYGYRGYRLDPRQLSAGAAHDPGLAFFYGGMVRAKSVLNMMMMSFIAMAIVPVLWVLYGYSMAFDTDLGSGLLGGFDKVGLQNVTMDPCPGPAGVRVRRFQVMFAIITVALISGAIADRAKFGAWALFVVVWVSLVYFPVAHWVFAFDDGNGGWIADRCRPSTSLAARPVHINAGIAALALAFFSAAGSASSATRCARTTCPFVLLGAGLLWFGWFGFNAGSAVGANGLAGSRSSTPPSRRRRPILGWLLVEVVRDKHATTVGGASGAIAGLVAITPACAAVSPMGAIAVGLVAGVLCALAVGLKYSSATTTRSTWSACTSSAAGRLPADRPPRDRRRPALRRRLDLLGKQAIAVGAVLAYSFVVTLVIGKLIDLTIGFRVSEEEEVTGIDSAQHLETGYDFTSLSGGVRSLVGAASSTPPSPVKEPTHEAGHRGHQAAQVGGRPAGAGGLRRDRA
jgi:Amt family ammonium transporter